MYFNLSKEIAVASLQARGRGNSVNGNSGSSISQVDISTEHLGWKPLHFTRYVFLYYFLSVTPPTIFYMCPTLPPCSKSRGRGPVVGWVELRWRVEWGLCCYWCSPCQTISAAAPASSVVCSTAVTPVYHSTGDHHHHHRHGSDQRPQLQETGAVVQKQRREPQHEEHVRRGQGPIQQVQVGKHAGGGEQINPFKNKTFALSGGGGGRDESEGHRPVSVLVHLRVLIRNVPGAVVPHLSGNTCHLQRVRRFKTSGLVLTANKRPSGC